MSDFSVSPLVAEYLEAHATLVRLQWACGEPQGACKEHCSMRRAANYECCPTHRAVAAAGKRSSTIAEQIGEVGGHVPTSPLWAAALGVVPSATGATDHAPSMRARFADGKWRAVEWAEMAAAHGIANVKGGRKYGSEGPRIADVEPTYEWAMSLHVCVVIGKGNRIIDVGAPHRGNCDAALAAEVKGYTVQLGGRRKTQRCDEAIVCRIGDAARYTLTPRTVIRRIAEFADAAADPDLWQAHGAQYTALGEYIMALPEGANGALFVTDGGRLDRTRTVYMNRIPIAEVRYSATSEWMSAATIGRAEGEARRDARTARNRSYDAEYAAASRAAAEDLRKGGRNTRYSAGQKGGVLTLGNEGRAVSARAHGVWFGPWIEGEGGIVAELRADEKANHDEREMLNAGLTRVNPLRHRGHAVRVAGAWWAAPSRYRMGSRTPLGAVRGVMK